MSNQRPNFDKTFCGKLPLHQTNLIQPHGVLLVVATEDFQVLQASENCTELLDIPAQEAVRQRLDAYLPAEDLRMISEKMTASGGGKLPLTLRFGKEEAEPYTVFLHQKDHFFILEIELKHYVQNRFSSFVQVFQELKQLIATVEKAATVEEVCTVAAREIKALTGFDKVMIYSFDPEWNGTVRAEALEEGMDRYLGLKFPASDVPKPARDMYFKNPYRIIPNRDYTPVKLYPLLNPVTNTFTNLSDSDLRSVAAVHIEYLKNMGVTASMSTRIVHEGSLWGLVSCHHRAARYLSFEECSIMELLSNILSARITVLTNGERYRSREALTASFRSFIESMHRS
ncbi:MAG TPA: GAF domain-containing protein, partial [Chitinophagaceae bacterium]|nr:GAF domain-containing protein [Chitinophagaceae bacterium]